MELIIYLHDYSLFCQSLIIFHPLSLLPLQYLDTRISDTLTNFNAWIYNREKAYDARYILHWMIVKTLIDDKYW